jgi:predicted nucleic acid-binding Zn ribbon protein
VARVDAAGPGLEKIVADCVRRMPKDQAPIIAWPLVCGSAVAERTRAIGFSQGILCVEVADNDWRRELQGLAPRYLAAINEYVGDGVKRLEFVVRGESPAAIPAR